MKLQCSCGAKYAFDITPEMAQNPVKFVCPQCGADSSDFVNQLVRNELGLPPAAAPAAPPPPAPVVAAAPVAPPPPAGSRLKISREEAPAPAAEAAPASKFCSKHRGVLATEQCAVCHKPICPQCMDLFGFFCSPLCKNKADMQGIAAPVYAGQRYNVEARFWRKTGLIFGSSVGAIILFFGVWTWYAWFGSVPHPYFSQRFENDPAYSGKVETVGQDQLVFLHGGTLARYSLKTKKPVWTRELVTQQQVDDEVKAEDQVEAQATANGGGGIYHHTVMHDEVVRQAKIGLQESLILHVSGQNIWVANGDKMTQYDWATGNPGKEVALPEAGDDLVEANGELLVYGPESVTHVSLADGESHVEKIGGSGGPGLASSGNMSGGGLPESGGDAGPMDPQKVASEAQNLKLQARLALPALVANAKHEQELEAAMRDDPVLRRQHDPASDVGLQSSRMIPGENGAVQFTTVMLEEKVIEHEAMKAPPKKSALDGDVNAAHTGEIANELLNEMQRNNGGDKVQEDVSHYRVTVHLPDSPDVTDWSAEVTGSPSIYPLKTVTVVAAGKTVIVLDKSNKQIWSATLTYNLISGDQVLAALFGQKSQYGDGPCVEHGGTLYIFDQAVLSAFDLATGNARWRLPSVGVVGLFFDDQGNVYVNTTSGNPDDIRYSRQIDITKTTDDIVSKVDSKTGRRLWSIKPGGFVSYVSGKFVYMTQSNDPNPKDEPMQSDTLAGFQKPPFFRVLRVNPRNGHTMFDYYQDRAPFYVNFDRNTIELVFKKEVQVLKYLSF